MVLTSSTQWTIPLAASTITGSSSSASAPSVAKNGSMLGLKTCQLSAPSSSFTENHEQELRSSSSRRLQDALLGADWTLSNRRSSADWTLSNRRSAGSFRQLINEELSSWDTKQHAEKDGDDVADRYDGIAIPWSSVHHYGINDDFEAPKSMVRGGGHGVGDDEGDITADDVDLLPMPGAFMSSSSTLYESMFPSCNVANYKTTSVSLLANGSKCCGGAAMVSNYSGLPPFTNEAPSVSRGAEVKDEEVCHTVQASMLNGKYKESFVDSLTSLWSNDLYPAHMLHNDSDSLSSIFNVFPQNFHGFCMSAEPDHSYVDNGTVIKSNFSIGNELHYLTANGDQKAQAGRDASIQPSVPVDMNKSRGLGTDRTVKEATVNRAPVTASSHAELQPSHVPKASRAQYFAEMTCLSLPDIDTASCVIQMDKHGGIKGAKRSFSTLQDPHMKAAMPTASSCSSVANSSKGQQDYITGSYCHIGAGYGLSSLEEQLAASNPPPAKVRRRHGTAMDPQSIAARSRREKFSERIRILQSLVPNGDRLDTVSMLGQTLEYVRFLQHQVWQLYHGKEPDNTCEKWKDFVEPTPASAG